MVVAFDILFLLPVFILGGILLLFGVIVLLGRWRGGKYLKPLLMQLQKIPFMKRWMQQRLACRPREAEPRAGERGLEDRAVRAR